MFVLAVTGGIGAGKSEACRLFRSLGATVLDTDDLAKSLLEPGTDAYVEVVEAFGSSVLDADGGIDRSALARAAFATDGDTRRLNRIVHPRVTALVDQRLDELALEASPPRVVVVDVPLLVEAPDVADLVDLALTVEAPETERIVRCVASGMDEADVRRRMDRQSGEGDRRAVTDAVVDNSGSLEEFHAQLHRFWEDEVLPRVT